MYILYTALMLESKIASFAQMVVDVDSLVKRDVAKILRNGLARENFPIVKNMLHSPPNTVPKSHERS